MFQKALKSLRKLSGSLNSKLQKSSISELLKEFPSFKMLDDNALFYEINSSEFYTKFADKSFLRKFLLAKLFNTT